MKVNTVRSKFLGGINAVKDVVKGDDEANPLRYVKIETMGTDSVLLTGSNGDVQVTSRVFCEVVEDGRCALAGSYLTRFVGGLAEGPVGFRLDDSRAFISGGGAKFSLATGDVEAYPVMKGPSDGRPGYATFPLPAATLGSMLGMTSFAACQDRTRSIVCGVNMSAENGWLRMCALDGRRLALASVDAALPCENLSATVPNAAVAVLQKLLKKFPDGDVLVQVDDMAARFTAPLWSVTTKLVADVFPEFRRAIPKECAHEVAFDREIFLEVLRRVALGSYGCGDGAVKVCLDGGYATLEARSAVSFAKELMEVAYDAEKFAFKVNPDVMSSVVERVPGKEFRLGFSGPTDPLRIACDGTYVGVVMPLREV